MTTPTPDLKTQLHDLEARLDDTQRRLDRTRRWWGLAALGAIGLLGLAAMDTAVLDVIRARQLEIINDQGAVVFAASAEDNGGRIDLWTPEGCNVLRLSANDHGGDVAVWNCAGRPVAAMFTTEAGGEVAIWDDTGDRAAQLLDQGYGGVLNLSNDGLIRSSLASGETSAGLLVFNATGDPVLSTLARGDQGYLEVGSRIALSSEGDTGQILVGDLRGNPATSAIRLVSEPGHTQLAVQDDRGAIVTKVGSGSIGPMIGVLNTDQEVVAFMTERQEGGGQLTAADAGGTEVASIRSDPGGNGRLDLSDQKGTVMATMQARPEAGATLALLAPNQTTACALAASEAGGVINLSNGQGVPVVVGGIAAGRKDGTINIYNYRGVPVVTAGSTVGGAGQLVLNDDEGHRLLGLPQRFTSNAEPPVSK